MKMETEGGSLTHGKDGKLAGKTKANETDG